MDPDQEIRRPWGPLYIVLYLPTGIPAGFIGVTLGYELRQRGVDVAAIAGIVGLFLLPAVWKVLGGPMLDLSLTPRKWSLLTAGCVAASLGAMGFVSATVVSLPLLGLLALICGIAAVLLGASNCNIIGAVEPIDKRGPIGGYVQAGNLGGGGLGGGAGLWLAQHAGGTAVAGLVLSAACLLCALPLLSIRAPARRGPDPLGVKVRQLGRDVWALVRSREGALALLLNLLPMGLGASNKLLSSVAGDWKASGNVVALVTGVLTGVACIGGSLAGGALCRSFHPRPVYFTMSCLSALLLAAMALAPHTLEAFVLFTLTSAVLLGATWGSLSSVTYVCIGRESAATKAALISSVSNAPLVAAIPIVGSMQTRYGSNAMLLTEAGMAAAGLIVYAAVAALTEPRPSPAQAAPALP
jgi:MFS family permease